MCHICLILNEQTITVCWNRICRILDVFSQRNTTHADFVEHVERVSIPGVRHNTVQRHHPKFGAILSLAAARDRSEEEFFHSFSV